MQHNFFKIHLSTLYKNMKALIAISIANYYTQQSVSQSSLCNSNEIVYLH